MKKILILVAACALMMACGQSVEKKAIDYAEQAIEALKDGELGKFIEIGEEMETWYETLTEEEKAKVDEATQKWEKENADKLEEQLKDLF